MTDSGVCETTGMRDVFVPDGLAKRVGEFVNAPGACLGEVEGVFSGGWKAHLIDQLRSLAPVEVVVSANGLAFLKEDPITGAVCVVARASVDTGVVTDLQIIVASPVTGSPAVMDGERRIAPGITLHRFESVKTVTKQWGAERWLHEADAPYAFKVINLIAGKRTSLQYHEQKRESYFILRGHARLHYAQSVGAEVEVVDFPAGILSQVHAGAVHRVEAVTDVVLIEASTFDDGTDNIRLADDYARGNGRIDAEHSA